MVVSEFGDGSFRLQSGDTSLLVDSSNARLKADVTLRTSTPLDVNPHSPAEIVFPGEYEVKGLEIQGWAVPSEFTEKIMRNIYLVRWEDILFAFLGYLSKMLEPELLQKIGEADVVVAPIDGAHHLSSDQVLKIIKHIDPHLVITSSSKTAKDVSKIFGHTLEPQEKIVFKRKNVLDEEGTIVLLRSGEK